MQLYKHLDPPPQSLTLKLLPVTCLKIAILISTFAYMLSKLQKSKTYICFWYLFYIWSLIEKYCISLFYITGCLNVGSHDICARSDCIERIDGTTSHNFCCCYTDLCNQNFTKVTDVEYKQITAKKKVESWDNSQKKLTSIYCISILE